jgi:hypothetical protein
MFRQSLLSASIGCQSAAKRPSKGPARLASARPGEGQDQDWLFLIAEKRLDGLDVAAQSQRALTAPVQTEG